ncbi:MAG TPA: IPT/TIG domain-containing protein, partial [Thermoanaerobaculia bacterium]
VTLTASAATTVRVSATVNNVSRTVDVTFSAKPTTTPPISTVPSISSVSPAIGRPAGGEIIRITGTNFKAPVRVLFDTGLPLPVEASVVAVTATTIDVVTPAVNLGAGQQYVSDIIIITDAGSTAEQRVQSTDIFTFRNEQLTPRISTATPNSGPVTGGTMVKIFGDGFQAPVQVLFGTAEARVVEVKYGEILVETPAGRDTAPDGSGVVVGPVDIVVRNIASATSTSLSSGFFYKNAVQITAVGPTEGLFSGGTRVQIDGSGFLAPVAVTIGGVAAQPISVSGTRIIALTSGVNITTCADVTGPVSVTNIANGDQASGPAFTYRVPKPSIIGVSPSPIVEGGIINVVVANAQPGTNRIKLGDRVVFPTSAVFAADGSATFTVAVPTNFEFPTEACTNGSVTGERDTPLLLDVTYQNVQTSCADTATDALVVNPSNNTCQLPPPAELVQVNPISPACADAGTVSAASGTGTATITFSNIGGQPLTIVRNTITGPQAAEFSVAPSSLSIDPGQSGSFTVTFDPAAAGANRSATVNFVTNDTDEGSINVCLEGDATP